MQKSLVTTDYILWVMTRLQFMGRSHNSKNYERILMKFSGNVQKKVSEQVIRFWSWWNAYCLRQRGYVLASVCLFDCLFVCVQYNLKSYKRTLMKFLGNVPKDSLSNGLDFGGDGMLTVYGALK